MKVDRVDSPENTNSFYRISNPSPDILPIVFDGLPYFPYEGTVSFTQRRPFESDVNFLTRCQGSDPMIAPEVQADMRFLPKLKRFDIEKLKALIVASSSTKAAKATIDARRTAFLVGCVPESTKWEFVEQGYNALMEMYPLITESGYSMKAANLEFTHKGSQVYMQINPSSIHIDCNMADLPKNLGDWFKDVSTMNNDRRSESGIRRNVLAILQNRAGNPCTIDEIDTALNVDRGFYPARLVLQDLISNGQVEWTANCEYRIK